MDDEYIGDVGQYTHLPHCIDLFIACLFFETGPKGSNKAYLISLWHRVGISICIC